MRFVHSFWSKPLLNNKFFGLEDALNINLIDYATSVEYVHKHGHEIVLYTDAIGADILGIIPYDDIIIIENSITDNFHFAASIKFEALKKMELGDILIDGDILLRSEKIYDYIKGIKGADAICSFFEPKFFIDGAKEKHERMVNILREFNFEKPYDTPIYDDFDGWHNTSLMILNNQELKDEYLRQYKKHLDIISDTDFNDIWPDIIIEQRHLTQLCRNNNYVIKELIEDYPSDEANNKALELGLVHLGNMKISCNDLVKSWLNELNPNMINVINEHIRLLKEK